MSDRGTTRYLIGVICRVAGGGGGGGGGRGALTVLAIILIADGEGVGGGGLGGGTGGGGGKCRRSGDPDTIRPWAKGAGWDIIRLSAWRYRSTVSLAVSRAMPFIFSTSLSDKELLQFRGLCSECLVTVSLARRLSRSGD